MMADKKRYSFDEAMKVAEEMQEKLKPACERLAIVGSLRRRKALVGDIEFLFVPRMSQRQDGFFYSRIVSVCDEVCEQLLKDGVLVKRPNVNGHFCWGEFNKLAIHVASGIPLDLFGTRPENWWVSLVIRTGSKELNLKLTTGAQSKGATLNAYGPGITISDGTIVPANSEEDVFAMCSVPYAEAWKR